MAQCVKCHRDTFIPGKRVCDTCMKEWTDMRIEAHEFCRKKFGELTRDTHPSYLKEMKRLEKIWRKDKDKFKNEIHERNT